MTHSLEAQLRSGSAELGLQLDEKQIGQLIAYLGLILKWNKVYNLTALKQPAEMVTHHLLDSLAVIQPLVRQTGGQPCSLLDVGSGAGLPGVVIAICCPHIKVDCVDAVGKKAAFLQQVSASLGLAGLRGVHARVEALTESYDVVTSRAFASLGNFVSASEMALTGKGVWLAMKGAQPLDEIAKLPRNVAVFHVEQLQIPDLQAERCIVWLKKSQAIT